MTEKFELEDMKVRNSRMRASLPDEIVITVSSKVADMV